MPQQTINLGTPPSGTDGDTVRTALSKCQSNFNELYASPVFTGNASVSGTLYCNGGTAQIGASSGTYRSINYQGIVTTSTPTIPGQAAMTLALTTSGSYGGGYGLVDGSYNIGLYSVYGTLNIGFGTGNGGLASKLTLTPSGNLTITGTLTQSDYRLKTVMSTVDRIDAMRAILGVRPVLYTMNDDPTRRAVAGVLAHELAEAIPHAVVGSKDETHQVPRIDEQGRFQCHATEPRYQSVDYNSVFVTLLAAFQQLVGDVEALKAELRGLMLPQDA
ncbi:hypothetical protein RKE25_21590 [Dyella sp. BiH032]|uniref:tail fiber domain-containing protein n=1 Tax=Dyella sp. BiH032 TaxID=3075430 RepID=UPI002892F30C|nr:tail fiber domain-containing protein [Dyella sp. BiH032]WNL45970.1 hypothetical protein RKE25_21590 [Dyella sp. BiH032]